MTGTTHLTGVPDLKTSLISKPVTLEIREIRVSTVAWEVQPRLKFLSQIQPRLKFLSQIQPRLNFVAIFERTNGAYLSGHVLGLNGKERGLWQQIPRSTIERRIHSKLLR